jgi:hypothetical protein
MCPVTINDDTTPSSRVRWLMAIVVMLAVAVTIVWWPGCRQYPPVSSPESLQLMKLLYAACNTKDTIRLTKVEQGIATLSAQGKFTDRERSSFESIVAMAKSGEWSRAEAAAFKFAQDQVGMGHRGK